MLIAIAAALLIQATPVPSYWGDLKPGPQPVGFTQTWIIDSTRRLPGGDRYNQRYRPVLMNIWYPARSAAGKPQVYGDYFTGAIPGAPTAGLRAYATALIDYQQETAWYELAKEKRDSTEPQLARRIEALFTGPSYARRDAPRGKLSPRVIVYTSGAGSSMDDNVVLCEYLASHGYTVIGSAYPAEDSSSFATDVSDQSRPHDIARMLMELPRLRIPMTGALAIGHSAGAQALQWYATSPSAAIDAILSLDTTQDYSMVSDSAWTYPRDVLRERRRVRIPIVFVASRSALFELADSLAWTRRTLLTVPDIGHNDFISQGIVRYQLLSGLAGEQPAEHAVGSKSYTALAEYALAWANAFPNDVLEAQSPIALQVLPLGEKFPALRSDTLRTARELRHLFTTTANTEEFARRALLARQADPEIAPNSAIMMLLVDAIRRGKPEQARSAYAALVARDSTLKAIPDVMESRANLFARYGINTVADDWRKLRKALVD